MTRPAGNPVRKKNRRKKMRMRKAARTKTRKREMKKRERERINRRTKIRKQKLNRLKRKVWERKKPAWRARKLQALPKAARQPARPQRPKAQTLLEWLPGLSNFGVPR